MKTWQVTQLGDPQDALSLVDTSKPVPKAGEVLIKVEAIALKLF